MKEFESRNIFDPHNHTNDSFDLIAHDSEVLLEMAILKRLKAVGKTEHNTLKGAEKSCRIFQEAAEKTGGNCPFLVLGAEVTCLVKKKWSLEMVHLLVLGLDRNSKEARRIPVLNSVPEVAKWAHGVGALIGPSHPAVSPEKRTNSLSDVQIIEYLEKYPGLFDFMETTSRKIGKDQRLIWLAEEKLGLLPIGSSDSHSREMVGLGGTVIPVEAKVNNQTELIEWLRTKPQTETYLAPDIPERLIRSRTVKFIVQEFIRERFL